MSVLPTVYSELFKEKYNERNQTQRAGLEASCNLAAAAEPVDINSADATTLTATTDGVGIKRAQAIVAFRQQNGPFKSVDELSQIRGIGDKTIAASKERLTAN